MNLEQRLLHPEGNHATVTVTLPTGEAVKGKLVHVDEFTVALREDGGRYRSWAANRVRFKVDDPIEAHVELLGKYSDDDIHNLMAYLQTLK